MLTVLKRKGDDRSATSLQVGTTPKKLREILEPGPSTPLPSDKQSFAETVLTLDEEEDSDDDKDIAP